MCTHILLLAMATVDPAAVIELAKAHDFHASRSLWHGEPLQHGDFALFDPDGSGCDCGTPIGSGHRPEVDLARLEQEARSGKRSRWSAARRQRWIAQRLQSTHRPAGVSPADAEARLGRWCALARAAAATPRIRRIGVLRLEAGDLPDDWQPPSTTVATVESLLRIAPRTPTWLLAP